MKLPKMIIFDYGGTLIHEESTNYHKGHERLFKHVKVNKNNITSKQLSDFSVRLFQEAWEYRYAGYEFHEWNFMRFVLEYLELELDISIAEAEKIIWETAAPGIAMPNVEKMLEYIHSRGIRSAVISNITWSGAALEDRINRLIPGHHFEFIIATSEYLIRKPNPMIFELAVKKAGLSAADAWYCGDSINADIKGSASAGLFPVWYDNENYLSSWRNREAEVAPFEEHLHIHDWNGLIEALDARVQTGGISANERSELQTLQKDF